jgi:hypothetical protein
MSERARLPHWPSGTVAILATGGEAPHAIPVSTAVRADDRRILLALARRRESLTRLRDHPRAALTLLCESDVAVTAHCRSQVVQESMEVSDRVAAIELTVIEVQEHSQPAFEILAGVRWRWTDEQAKRSDEQIRRALLALATRPPA